MAYQADVTKNILHWPILNRRIGGCAYALIGCELAFETLNIFKGQIPLLSLTMELI